jgi:hypothetical protein
LSVSTGVVNHAGYCHVDGADAWMSLPEAQPETMRK